MVNKAQKANEQLSCDNGSEVEEDIVDVSWFTSVA